MPGLISSGRLKFMTNCSILDHSEYRFFFVTPFYHNVERGKIQYNFTYLLILGQVPMFLVIHTPAYLYTLDRLIFSMVRLLILFHATDP